MEIGPGDGKLTEKIILKKPKKLTLIEIDKDLIKILVNKYSDEKKIELVNENFLKYEIKKNMNW